MRLIDADELYKKALDIIKDEASYKAFAIVNAISTAPTIEAEPVRHGKWIDSGINGTVSCSLCKFTDFFAKQNRVMLFKYCPGCGAKMDGENDGRE